MSLKRALVVVAKEPVAGQTKTRLSPPLAPEEAVALYRCFLLDTLDLMARVEGVDPLIAYTPHTAEGYFRRLAPDGFALMPQVGASLGQRLDHVLTRCLEGGYDQAAVMNSDGPTLPVEYLGQAFEYLDDPHVDVVLGPSEDGGYYLIALKRPCAALFDVEMSTPTVCQETLALAHSQGLRVVCLDSWYDIDTPEDLDRLIKELSLLPSWVAVRTRRFLRRFDLAWKSSRGLGFPSR
ncbi:MAG: TIGR04282 family arsenosugar biosynthesis glycosyltransferase [Chloroflexi bacterium]|nr:TIGR04282 family arsenosugar biosynthesis glycosyltransferase [Chloroflexota bacterium]